ncbi:hypothetical protein AgCh_025588 [Apium graveolens]
MKEEKLNSDTHWKPPSGGSRRRCCHGNGRGEEEEEEEGGILECLLGLPVSKTVIYVTHQVEFLPTVDLILVMKDGRITQSGKYGKLLDLGNDFIELVGAHKTALSALISLDTGPTSKSSNIGENSSTGNFHSS